MCTSLEITSSHQHPSCSPSPKGYFPLPSFCVPPSTGRTLAPKCINTLTHLWNPQFSSVTQSCPTLCHPMDCSTPGFPVYHQLRELAQTHVHQVGDAIQPFHPLLSPSPPAFDLFQHQGLSHGVSSLHQVAIVWRFSISPSNEYSGLIFFRMDWFDLLAVQGTLKSLLQHHSSKASILWHSAFFIVQLSHSYMTTGKNHSCDYEPLLVKWCLCFLICCLGWS